MTTSKTSTPDIDRKAEVLSTIPIVKQEWAPEFLRLWDMSVPFAMAYNQGWVDKLSEKGIQNINDCYSALCELFDMTEAEMANYLAD